MNRAILILKEKTYSEILPILPLVNYQAIGKTENAVDGLRMAQRVEPDLILCGWDIKGMAATDLIQNLILANICPLVLIIEEKEINNLQTVFNSGVHHVLISPLRAVEVVSGIMHAEYRYQHELQKQKELRKLNDELKTRKLIYQASLILIAEGFNEETAYNAMRTEAMASRKTIRTLAKEVIRGTWRPV